MRFYKFTTETEKRIVKWHEDYQKDEEEFENEFNKNIKEFKAAIKEKDTELAEEMYDRDFYFHFSSVDKKKSVFALATKRDDEILREIQAHFRKYLSYQKYKVAIEKTDEITIESYKKLIREGDSNGFIEDDSEIFEQYGFEEVFSSYRYSGRFQFEEYLLKDEMLTLEVLQEKEDVLNTMPKLREEFGRIFKTTRNRWQPGNPVHYVMSSDEGKDRNEYLLLLIQALFSQKRIASKRFIQVDYEKLCDRFSGKLLKELFKIQTGGTIVFSVKKETMQDSDYVTGDYSRASNICRLLSEWKNKVLIIFVFPRDSAKMQEVFFEELDGVSLVRIEETVLFDEDAKTFLSKIAKETRLRSFSDLLTLVEKGVGYSKSDLRNIFERWYTTYLKDKVFPQYKREAIMMKAAEKNTKGNGYEKLHSLIGLSETKELVSNILDFAKAQAMFSDDKKRPKQSLHMIFSGNPGTAKTTVARLIAQILKENNVLETGDLIEVGRADLVGRFVGWTAPTVKHVFKRATGSVLFIDEAYSLVDDRDGCYGDEAITTIVQEMENHRDDVVVIFAGYTDKMEGFLGKNPGLRSRIGFHVNFPDYSPDELFNIMEHLSGDYGIQLADDVRARVYPMIEKAAGIPEFGNGRYIRNLLEKARMKQATRLIKMDQKQVTEQISSTLVAEDFEEIRLSVNMIERKIGFVG